jgi:hypothetical protein
MRDRVLRGVLLVGILIATGPCLPAQEERPARAPREFTELRGTWILDESARTGATLDRRFSFSLVAGMLALTSKRTRGSLTNIITDAYAVRGEVLTVERQLSVLMQPPGSLMTLSDERNNRQTLVYRRTR